MKNSRIVLFSALVLTVLSASLFGQPRPTPDAALIARRNAVEAELESVATISRKVMVPMRDGKRMQADIYRPRDNNKQYPYLMTVSLVTRANRRASAGDTEAGAALLRCV